MNEDKESGASGFFFPWRSQVNNLYSTKPCAKLADSLLNILWRQCIACCGGGDGGGGLRFSY